MVSQWVGQLQFQNEIMQLEGACLIKGVSSPAFRHASHIKPWRTRNTTEEPLGSYNGLTFTPHIDQLFDQDYISFDFSGVLVLSDG